MLDFIHGANLSINRKLIPEHLWPLIPFVEKWGFEKLGDQDCFVEYYLENYPNEIREFNEIIDQYADAIREWSQNLSAGNKHKKEITQQEWSHPIWSFLDVLKLREITGGFDDDTELSHVKGLVANEVRLEQFHKALTTADALFREKDYRGFLQLLNSFQDLLSTAHEKKFQYARRKVNQSPE